MAWMSLPVLCEYVVYAYTYKVFKMYFWTVKNSCLLLVLAPRSYSLAAWVLTLCTGISRSLPTYLKILTREFLPQKLMVTFRSLALEKRLSAHFMTLHLDGLVIRQPPMKQMDGPFNRFNFMRPQGFMTGTCVEQFGCGII